MYGNHADLRVAIQRSGVPREELWITSKVATVKRVLSKEAVKVEVGKILLELGVSYLDLLLLHHAKNNNAEQRAEQWRGLMEAKPEGKVRHIGVSNFDRAQIEALKAVGDLPAVNQLEFHPWVQNEMHDLVRWCQANGVAVTAYGSLGSSSAGAKAGDNVAEVAARHGVSSAAVLLRWALSRGCAVIPGATSAKHIYENLHPRPFVLTADDEAKLLDSKKPSKWRLWNNMGGGH